MSFDSIARLYRNFATIEDSEREDVDKCEKEYKEILQAVKGTEKEKRLALQFIPRFLENFPTLSEDALEAQFDLCEDTEISIRKHAIRDLPQFAKVNTKFTYRISDALGQLLQAADSSELAVVQNTLLNLFKHDPKGTVLGLFNQIKNGDDGIREKGLKFTYTKIMAMVKDLGNTEAEELFITELKKVYQDANSEEIPLILDLMLATKLGTTSQGQKEVVEFVFEQLNNERPFTTTDDDLIERLTVSIKHIIPLLSREVESNKFVEYLCDEVLPKIKMMSGFDDGSENVLEVLKVFAECSMYCSTLPSFEKSLSVVYDLLIELMPAPADDNSTDDSSQEPRLQFSYVECLLYSLHQLAKHYPDMFSDANKLKNFRSRLQYFARALQGYIKTLHESLKGKSEVELRSDENKLKTVALKTTSNINTLIKDFFHTPPSYKSIILLSWSSPSTDAKNSKKRRHIPISFDEDCQPVKSKMMKSIQRELYQPPNGKYSSNIIPPNEQTPGIRTKVRLTTFRGFGRMRRNWRRKF